MSETSAEKLRHALRLSIVATELLHTQIQVRLAWVLLAGAMLWDFIDPALLILTVNASMVHRIALMTQHPLLVGATFLVLAAGVVPFVVLQLLAPASRWRRSITKLACLTLVAGGLLWVFLAWNARHVDVEVVGGIFLRTGLGAFLSALALALSLNQEQTRCLLECPA